MPWESERDAVRTWLVEVASRLSFRTVDPIGVAVVAHAIDRADATTAVTAVLADRLDSFGGGGVPWYGNPESLLIGLAQEVFRRVPGDLDTNFTNVWDEWIRFVNSDLGDSVAIAAVRRIWLSSSRIEFEGDSFYLQQLPEELAVERWSDRSGFDGHALGFFRPFHGAPWATDFLSRPDGKAQQELAERVATAWRALSLVVPSNASFPLPDTDYFTVMGSS